MGDSVVIVMRSFVILSVLVIYLSIVFLVLFQVFPLTLTFPFSLQFYYVTLLFFLAGRLFLLNIRGFDTHSILLYLIDVDPSTSGCR